MHMKTLCVIVALTSAGINAETVSVSADSGATMGMVTIQNPAKKNAEAAIGVPFLKSFEYGEMTVDGLLKAGYGSDDDIRLWNSAGYYDSWYWDEDEGCWMIVGGKIDPPEAEEQEVARGKAFWYRNESLETNDLVLAGLVKPGVVTTVEKGSRLSSKMTLMINPYGTAFDLVEKFKAGMASGDQVVLVDTTDRYEYIASKKKWCKRIPGGKDEKGVTRPDTFVEYTTLPIAEGKAFWYISKGGNPTVSWD